MPAPYNDPQSKIDEALKARAESVSLSNRGGALVHVGLGNAILALPRIETAGEASGEEEPPDSGNHWFTCIISIYSDADGATALADHKSRVSYVFDAFNYDTLADLLSSAVTDFACQGIRNRSFPQQRKEDRHFITQFSFDALCSPSDL